MGILRTDKISGLETPTPVTGSVNFPGTTDYLDVSNSNDFDFNSSLTFELFFNLDSLPETGILFARGGGNTSTSWSTSDGAQFALYVTTSGVLTFEYSSSGTPKNITSSTGAISLNNWYHAAVAYDGSTFTLYLNGVSQGTRTDSPTMPTTRNIVRIGMWPTSDNTQETRGNISNLRFVKGTEVYTSDFTVPTHELEVIGDTVLLCCNNPDSAGAEATGKTITVNGDAAASTVSPGLTRDFTYGTEFKGVTTFDTQGYFVPPSGTTEQRGRGRGVIGSGYVAPARVNTIDYITVQTEGNAQDFGDLTVSRSDCANISSSTRGIFAGGIIGYSNVIDFITIATTSNAVDFGDISAPNQQMAGVSNSTRGLIGGGKTPASNPAGVNTIDYITIASLGDAQTFGELLAPQAGHFGTGSETRGIFAGGYTPAETNVIQYVTIASTGDAVDFGDLTLARGGGAGGGNSTRGLFFAGYNAPTLRNTIDYITISSTGNAQDFGDATSIRGEITGCCSIPIRGVFSGGNPNTNAMDYVTIASTGNATDFGDLSQARRGTSSLSDSHGGIS